MKKTEKKYSGVIVPMVTPFTGKGKIDYDAVEKIIENFISAKIYPFIIGTTGESASISDMDKMLFTEFVCRKFADRTKIYAGIASNIFETSVEQGKKFFDMGVTATVANLPSYYPLKPYHMKKYFEELVNAINGPLFIYNITATTHMSIPLELIEELSYHENIVGFKDSERDEARLDKSIETWKDREDFSHLIGWAAKSTEGILKGSDGIVPSTGNVVPELYYKLYKSVLDGNIEEAELMQKITNEFSSVYQKDRILCEALPALKVMMNYMELCSKSVLSPAVESDSDNEEKIIAETKELLTKYEL